MPYGVHVGLDAAQQFRMRHQTGLAYQNEWAADDDPVVEAVSFPSRYRLASVAVGAGEIAEDHPEPCQVKGEERLAERSLRKADALRTLDGTPLPGLAVRHPALEAGHTRQGSRRYGDRIVGQSPERRNHLLWRAFQEPVPGLFEHAPSLADVPRVKGHVPRAGFDLGGEPRSFGDVDQLAHALDDGACGAVLAPGEEVRVHADRSRHHFGPVHVAAAEVVGGLEVLQHVRMGIAEN